MQDNRDRRAAYGRGVEPTLDAAGRPVEHYLWHYRSLKQSIRPARAGLEIIMRTNASQSRIFVERRKRGWPFVENAAASQGARAANEKSRWNKGSEEMAQSVWPYSGARLANARA
jgi:hypothetical protein